MFIKTCASKKNGKIYKHYQIVESYREEKYTRHRVITNLGSLSQKSIASLIRGLNRLKEKPLSLEEAELKSKKVLEYGAVSVLRSLWNRLGISEMIRDHLKETKVSFDVAHYAMLMTIHRLIDPSSKLKLTDLFLRIDFPEIRELDYQKILRSLVYLYQQKDEIEKDLFEKQKDLFNLKVDLVFYDITSTYFEGEGPEFAVHGYSRDHRRDRPQILIALAVTQEGLPIGHETYAGNTSDKTTVKDVIEKLRGRFSINKCIFVGDRGMVSPENEAYLKEHGYEYIFALKKRRLRESREQFEGDLSKYQTLYDTDFDGRQRKLFYLEQRSETEPRIRYIVCHNEIIFKEDTDYVTRRLDKIEARLTEIKTQYKKAATRFKYAAQIPKIGRFFKYGLDKESRFFCVLDEEAVAFEKLIAGKFVLKTDNQTLSAEDIIQSYKTLAVVEQAFKNLKSFIDIQPHYHREDEHVKGHVFICVLAYLLARTLEKYVSRPNQPVITAARILDQLSSVKVVENELNGITIGTVIESDKEVREILKRLGLPGFPGTTAIFDRTVKLPAATVRKLKRYSICSK